MLHFVVGTIMHGYNTVEHSVTGSNNCTGPNYCKALIYLYLFRRLLTIMSTQEAAIIALKTCKSICSDIKCCNLVVRNLNQHMVKISLA